MRFYPKLGCAFGQEQTSYNLFLAESFKFFCLPSSWHYCSWYLIWARSNKVEVTAEVDGKTSLTFVNLDIIRRSKSCLIHVNKEASGPLPGFITIAMSTLGDTDAACSHLGAVPDLGVESVIDPCTAVGMYPVWCSYRPGLSIILKIPCFIWWPFDIFKLWGALSLKSVKDGKEEMRKNWNQMWVWIQFVKCLQAGASIKCFKMVTLIVTILVNNKIVTK